ncbi:methylenetetrahydrofolate reductase [Acetobacter sp. DsW_063]|uniref:methylenetetrahydrofolate reductase n=1 Tax=Acetobacter sp. DsW_063 TaxID=1514894 RepID=UPI000A36C76E|nr:methylenetetrahydrofolate reductase [Acetobacter sp. DsW_063]
MPDVSPTASALTNPRRVSVELIPRDEASLRNDAGEALAFAPQADTINIPDLMRFDLRSWKAVSLVRDRVNAAIPHIRAIDVDPNEPLPGTDDPAIREVLVIRGDPPADLNRRTFPNSSESIIRRYQREAPGVAVYAAFDPYRQAPYQELDAVQRKRDAGARGFFTQPIFDMRMLDLCREWLSGENVFWGLSPVIGPRSRSYWETTNRVIFPRNFEPTLDANIAFADAAIRSIRSDSGSVYIMPLRVKLANYLTPLAAALSS